MKTKWPPEPEIVIRDLGSLAALVYPAMDAAADHAITYFEQSKFAAIDPWMYSHLVRHYVKPRLAVDGVENLGYRFISLPFSGLLLENDRYCIRILKIDRRPDYSTRLPRREIHGPGPSQARKEWFYQPAFEFDDDDSPLARLRVPQRLRLVMLWDVDRAYQLTGLEIACPRYVDSSSNMVYTHWWMPIPDARKDNQGELPAEFEGRVQLEDLEITAVERDRASGE